MTRAIVLGLVVLCLAGAAAGPAPAARSIPPPPGGENYVYDSVDLLDPDDLAHLQRLARESLERYNAPIVVVTIARVSDYGASSVEDLARRWFNQWQIGTLGLERGANKGILLLVATADRKARIELGASWGQGFNGMAQQIMAGVIVPRFKSGDFAAGIRAGVQNLAAMAKAGPASAPPGQFLERHVRPMCQLTFLEPQHLLLAAVVGVLMIVLGCFLPEHRKLLILGGLVVLAFAFLSYLVMVVLFFILPPSKGRRSGSSGRGYSGGSSGGGGATGSW